MDRYIPPVSPKACRIVSAMNLVCAFIAAATGDGIWVANFVMALACWAVAEIAEKKEKEDGEL